MSWWDRYLSHLADQFYDCVDQMPFDPTRWNPTWFFMAGLNSLFAVWSVYKWHRGINEALLSWISWALRRSHIVSLQRMNWPPHTQQGSIWWSSYQTIQTLTSNQGIPLRCTSRKINTLILFVVGRFEECNAFIEDARTHRDSRVLVHCRMGQSRSATLVVAYIMSHYKCSLKEALLWVKKHRELICPNTGYLMPTLVATVATLSLISNS